MKASLFCLFWLILIIFPFLHNGPLPPENPSCAPVLGIPNGAAGQQPELYTTGTPLPPTHPPILKHGTVSNVLTSSKYMAWVKSEGEPCLSFPHLSIPAILVADTFSSGLGLPIMTLFNS